MIVETLKNLPAISELLRRNHVDLRDLRTLRQTLFLARKLSGSRIKWPQAHEPEFPVLLELERQLERPRKRRKRK